MKIFWRVVLGLALFYFVVGIIGLFVDRESAQDYKESAAFGGSVAAVILAAKGAAALREKLQANKQERRSPAIPREMKLAIHREACLVAILLERLASERYVQEKELPPGIQITTRRVLLARLAKLELREGLEPWLNDLLLAPDGHWTDKQKQRVDATWEYFALLWWGWGVETCSFSRCDQNTVSRTPRLCSPSGARPACLSCHPGTFARHATRPAISPTVPGLNCSGAERYRTYPTNMCRETLHTAGRWHGVSTRTTR
jgi:hypothetical protein